MAQKATVVIEKDEDGYYAYCAELEGCQTQGETVEEVLRNIKEAIALYLSTLTEEEKQSLLSREVLTATVEVA
jgi:predicted RNase H-like HicB family nuclease